MNFDIYLFFGKKIEKIPVSLKYDKNNLYFTWLSVFTYDHIFLSSC